MWRLSEAYHAQTYYVPKCYVAKLENGAGLIDEN